MGRSLVQVGREVEEAEAGIPRAVEEEVGEVEEGEVGEGTLEEDSRP